MRESCPARGGINARNRLPTSAGSLPGNAGDADRPRPGNPLLRPRGRGRTASPSSPRRGKPSEGRSRLRRARPVGRRPVVVPRSRAGRRRRARRRRHRGRPRTTSRLRPRTSSASTQVAPRRSSGLSLAARCPDGLRQPRADDDDREDGDQREQAAVRCPADDQPSRGPPTPPVHHARLRAASRRLDVGSWLVSRPGPELGTAL